MQRLLLAFNVDSDVPNRWPLFFTVAAYHSVLRSIVSANPWSKTLSAQSRRVPVVEVPHSVAGTGTKRFFMTLSTRSPAVRAFGPL